MLHEAFKIVDNVHFDIGKKNFRSRGAIEKLGAVLLHDIHEVNLVYYLKKNIFFNLKLS